MIFGCVAQLNTFILRYRIYYQVCLIAIISFDQVTFLIIIREHLFMYDDVRSVRFE